MTTIKNSIRKVALGLLTISIAIIFGAATSPNTGVESNLAMRFWVNDGSGNYELETNVDPLKCVDAITTKECIVQSENPNIPDSFPLDNPLNYPISAHSSSSVAEYQ